VGISESITTQGTNRRSSIRRAVREPVGAAHQR
jgi:hypothetical protein